MKIPIREHAILEAHDIIYHLVLYNVLTVKLICVFSVDYIS